MLRKSLKHLISLGDLWHPHLFYCGFTFQSITTEEFLLHNILGTNVLYKIQFRMQRSPLISLKLLLTSKTLGVAFDLLTSSIPHGMQHRLRLVCLWTSTHLQKQLRL